MQTAAVVKSLPAALSLIFLLQLPAVAANVTFIDQLDNTTLGADPDRAFGFACHGETCSVMLAAPAGTASIAVNSFFSGLVEPGTMLTSDLIEVGITNQQASISFTSDTEGTSLGRCFDCLVENGQVQTALTITWVNLAGAPILTDKINIQSDVAEVPEPSVFPWAAAAWQ